MDYINLNSEDDIPMWEHTVTAMVKIRTRNVSDSADVSWEIAKDDEDDPRSMATKPRHAWLGHELSALGDGPRRHGGKLANRSLW